MVCLVMAVLMEMANSKAVKKYNKKGAVAASPAKGKASPKGGKSPAKGKAAKKLKPKKDAKGIKAKKAKPAKKSKAAKAVKGAPKTVKKLAFAKTAAQVKEIKSPAKPMVLKAVPPHQMHLMNEKVQTAVSPPAHARSLATVPYSTPVAADRNSLPSYTSDGTNLDMAHENDDYQNYYYGSGDSSKEFDASAEEEDGLYEEGDGAMNWANGRLPDWALNRNTGINRGEWPPKSGMLQLKNTKNFGKNLFSKILKHLDFNIPVKKLNFFLPSL
uniref:Putative gland protein G20G04 n=1 Tax=Heterodera glycines TaxID=51029 RepID=Q86DG1_HETGL|nr:putative gland protein G20G04 [Heterodera glycines]